MVTKEKGLSGGHPTQRFFRGKPVNHTNSNSILIVQKGMSANGANHVCTTYVPRGLWQLPSVGKTKKEDLLWENISKSAEQSTGLFFPLFLKRVFKDQQVWYRISKVSHDVKCQTKDDLFFNFCNTTGYRDVLEKTRELQEKIGFTRALFQMKSSVVRAFCRQKVPDFGSESDKTVIRHVKGHYGIW